MTEINLLSSLPKSKRSITERKEAKTDSARAVWRILACRATQHYGCCECTADIPWQ